MATMMRELMNDFYDLREDNSGDFAYSMAIDQAVSYVNNCHQMTSCEILNRVESLLNDYLDVAYEEGEVKAIEDMLIIVDLHREKLLNEG